MAMANWTPVPTPWSRPSEDTIKALDKNPKLSDIIRVLHCTPGDYDSLTRPIETLLDELAIDPNAKLGSKVNKQIINNIVQRLKDGPLFRPMLTWAESQGEANDNVNKAIKCIIHNVHNARRKRSFRKESKDHLPSASPKVPAISSSQHQNSPVLQTEVSPIDEDPDLVLIKADTDTEAYYRLVPSGPAANTMFDELKAEWTTKAPTNHQSQECISFKILAGGFPGGIVDDARMLKILATRAKKNDETLVLMAQYGKRVRLPSRTPRPFDSNDPAGGVIPSVEDHHAQPKPPKTSSSTDRRPQPPLPSTPEKRKEKSPETRAQEKKSVNPEQHRSKKTKTTHRLDNDDLLFRDTDPLESDGEREKIPTPTPLAQDDKSVKPEQQRSKKVKTTDGLGTDDLEFREPSPRLDWEEELEDTPEDVDREIDSRSGAEDDESDQSSEDETRNPSPPLEEVNLNSGQDHSKPPEQLKSWSAAGTLSTVGTLILPSCYDNDPTQLGEGDDNADDGSSTLGDNLSSENDRAVEAQQKALQAQSIHVNEELFKEMCTFFRIDIDRARNYDSEFEVEGMRRPLRVYQLYGAYFIIRRESSNITQADGTEIPSTGMVLLGDQPGFGKSAQLAAICVLSVILEEAVNAVRQARASSDKGKRALHLPASSDEYEQDEAASCPTEPFSICCPCVERNPSSQLYFTRGTTIVVVPNALVINTVEEWYKQVDMKRNRCDFHVYAQVTQETGKKIQHAHLQMGDQVVKTDIRELYIPVEELQRLKKEKTVSNLSRHVFITASPSYATHMKANGIHELPCGRFARDEFHQEPHIANKIMGSVRELIYHRSLHPDRLTPKITMMSGTPIRLGARDLVGISSLWTLCAYLRKSQRLPNKVQLSSLSNPKNWEKVKLDREYAFWSSYDPWALSQLTGRWHKKPEECEKEWATLLSTIMIRRTKGAKWLDGQVLLPLPRMHYRLCECEMSTSDVKYVSAAVHGRFRQKLQRMKDVKSNDPMFSSIHSILQKCATFPKLARLYADDNLSPKPEEGASTFDFGVEYMRRWKVFDVNIDNGDMSMYHRHLKLLTRDNPKMSVLQSILFEQLQRKDFLGRPSKGIIFTKHNESALLVYKYIKDILQKSVAYKITPALVYGSMPKAARQKAAHEFQYEDETNILVGVSDALGTGLTLTRAQFVVLVEQQGDPGLHEQMIGRMLRRGNFNWDGVNCFELFCKNFTEEVALHARRLGREEFANKISEDAIAEVTKEPEKDDEDDEDEDVVSISSEEE